MRVLELWRYPVKSLQGERLESAEIGPEGIEGDRRFALFDLDTGFGLTARRVPELLFAGARLLADGGVEVLLPDGTVTADDAVLSAWTGRRVALRSATEEPGARRYENPADAEDEAVGRWDPFDGADGAFHDNAGTRVSLVSTGTIGSWPQRRFRANVLLSGAGEDDLVGSRVRLGGALLDIGMRVPRCVMTTRPQPDGIDRDLSVLRSIHRDRGGALSVGALVAEPGTVRIGDVLAPA